MANENLRRTPINKGSEREGSFLGLAGNLSVPIFLGAFVSGILALLLLNGEGSGTPSQFAYIASPTILSAAYVLLLKHNRPPRYDMNFWTLLFEGGDFNARPKGRRKLKHPVLSLRAKKGSK